MNNTSPIITSVDPQFMPCPLCRRRQALLEAIELKLSSRTLRHVFSRKACLTCNPFQGACIHDMFQSSGQQLLSIPVGHLCRHTGGSSGDSRQGIGRNRIWRWKKSSTRIKVATLGGHVLAGNWLGRGERRSDQADDHIWTTAQPYVIYNRVRRGAVRPSSDGLAV